MTNKSTEKKARVWDEMMEQKLLKIEHNGMWISFWGLLIAIVVQTIMGVPAKQMAGEWIVFMALALYTSIACLRAGIWERKKAPSPRGNLNYSLVFAAGFTVIQAIYLYTTNPYMKTFPVHFALILLYSFIIMTIIIFISLSIASRIYYKRREAIDNMEDEEITDSEDKGL